MKHAERTNLKFQLPGLAALLSIALLGTSAMADGADPKFTMTTIIDSDHGRVVAAGDYEQAIEKIAALDNANNEFFNNINLCVAYTKTNNLSDAVIACNSAVDQASEMTIDRRSDWSEAAQERVISKYRAMALSNRGVLHAVLGDIKLAREDFMEALDAKTHTRVVKVNLARLGEVEAKKV